MILCRLGGERIIMGKLIIVGTPIGNLGDMSPRALEALENCDFIAAEDTRVTLKILNRFGIKKPMTSYFEHNKLLKGERIVERILAGEDCALVTDAGMPAVSDPGELLVRQCAENGIDIDVVPGPSACISALAVSGLPTGRFTFEGFLPVNKLKRKEHIASLLGETRTMIFYEAPHKLSYTLRDLAAAFGDRQVAVVRELTKIHFEVVRATLPEAAERFAQNGPKGEIVLVVAGRPPAEELRPSLEEAVRTANEKMACGLSASLAAKEAAAETGHKKGDIYKHLGKDDAK